MHRMKRILAIAAAALLLAGCSGTKHAPPHTTSRQTHPPAARVTTNYGDSASGLLAKVSSCTSVQDTTKGAVADTGISSEAACTIAGKTVDLVVAPNSDALDIIDRVITSDAPEVYYATGTGWSAVFSSSDVAGQKDVATTVATALAGSVVHVSNGAATTLTP